MEIGIISLHLFVMKSPPGRLEACFIVLGMFYSADLKHRLVWYSDSSIVLGFFKSNVPAITHRRHNLLLAVEKLTREVMTLGRERVLPWYKEDGKEIEKSSFSGVHRVIRYMSI